MKKRLKTLFYGMSHEHAPGKIALLRKLPDDFEIVAVADDCGVQTDRYAGQLEELAAIVRGEIRDTADYEHDLRVHALTLELLK